MIILVVDAFVVVQFLLVKAGSIVMDVILLGIFASYGEPPHLYGDFRQTISNIASDLAVD